MRYSAPQNSFSIFQISKIIISTDTILYPFGVYVAMLHAQGLNPHLPQYLFLKYKLNKTF